MKCINNLGEIKWCCEDAFRAYNRTISYNPLTNEFCIFKTCSRSEGSDTLGVHDAVLIKYCPFCRAECKPFVSKVKKKFRRML